MKTDRLMKSAVAFLLILGILCGFVPASFPDWMQTIHARAEQEAENRAITRAVIRSLNASFEPIMALAAEEKEAGNERADGLWRYVLIMDKNWAVITGHVDMAAAELQVPQTLGGADVVGLAEGALADHSQLLKIDLPANLNAIADDVRGKRKSGFDETL